MDKFISRYIYIYVCKGIEFDPHPFHLLFYREIDERNKLCMRWVIGSFPSVSLIPSHAANYHIYKTALFHIQPWKLPAKRRGAWLIFNLDSLSFFSFAFILKTASRTEKKPNFSFTQQQGKFRIARRGIIGGINREINLFRKKKRERKSFWSKLKRRTFTRQKLLVKILSSFPRGKKKKKKIKSGFYASESLWRLKFFHICLSKFKTILTRLEVEQAGKTPSPRRLIFRYVEITVSRRDSRRGKFAVCKSIPSFRGDERNLVNVISILSCCAQFIAVNRSSRAI